MKKNFNTGTVAAIFTCSVCLFAVQMPAPVVASNADVSNPTPILKSGLWEIVVSNPVDPNKGSFRKRCAGSLAQETAFEKEVFEESQQTCKILSVTRSKDIVKYTATCEVSSGFSRTIKGEFAGDFTSEFVQKDLITAKPASPLGDMLYAKQFRFVGQCPADMKPGDSMVSHDRKKTFMKFNGYALHERMRHLQSEGKIEGTKPPVGAGK